MNMEAKKSNVVKEILGWIWAIAVAFVIAALIRTYIFEQVEIPTGSMIDTLRIHERFVVNKLIYRFKPIRRGDIVVFKYPDDPSETYVKRVIGVGGDIVEIRDGNLYVNGAMQIEPYIKEPMDPQRDFGPFVVSEGHYFMMGDNRNDSNDSRYWKHKEVKQSDIIGKLTLRVYPFNRIGFVK